MHTILECMLTDAVNQKLSKLFQSLSKLQLAKVGTFFETVYIWHYVISQHSCSEF